MIIDSNANFQLRHSCVGHHYRLAASVRYRWYVGGVFRDF